MSENETQSGASELGKHVADSVSRHLEHGQQVTQALSSGNYDVETWRSDVMTFGQHVAEDMSKSLEILASMTRSFTDRS